MRVSKKQVIIRTHFDKMESCYIGVSEEERKTESMSLLLEIPDHVAHAIRLPAKDQRQQVMAELAVALYARGILSFGKARALTSLKRVEFGMLLGRRGVPRHYTEQDMEDDISYARGK